MGTEIGRERSARVCVWCGIRRIGVGGRERSEVEKDERSTELSAEAAEIGELVSVDQTPREAEKETL